MSIKIRRMNMPPKEFDDVRSNKEARQGVAITALAGENRRTKGRKEQDNEITH